MRAVARLSFSTDGKMNSSFSDSIKAAASEDERHLRGTQSVKVCGLRLKVDTGQPFVTKCTE